MNNFKLVWLFAITLLLTNMNFAYANLNAHTWHVISTPAGNWHGSLKALSQKSSFVQEDGSALDTFDLSATHAVKYGFVFDPTDNFDVAYTLTLIEESTQFVSKTCVFVVTAKGPANPDVRALSYNGANCSATTVPGVGEDFLVS